MYSYPRESAYESVYQSAYPEICVQHRSFNRGGGTGLADPAAAGPIIYSEITRTKNYHKNIF